MKVRTSHGSWQIPSHALTVRNQLKRTKGATICHAKDAVMSFAGFVSVNGLSMDRRLGGTITATSTKK